MKKKLINYSLLLPILLSGCLIDNQAENIFGNNTWKLIAYGYAPGDTNTLSQGSNSTIQFDESEKSLNGKLQCNQFSTRYKLDENRISIKELALTNVSCSQDETKVATFISSVLNENPTYSIENGVLFLRSDATKFLKFQKSS